MLGRRCLLDQYNFAAVLSMNVHTDWLCMVMPHGETHERNHLVRMALRGSVQDLGQRLPPSTAASSLRFPNIH